LDSQRTKREFEEDIESHKSKAKLFDEKNDTRVTLKTLPD